MNSTIASKETRVVNVINADGTVMTDDELAEMVARPLSGLLEDIVVNGDGPDDIKLQRARDEGNRFAGIVADMFGDTRGKRIVSAAIQIILVKVRESDPEMATA
jgi:hypothetical protein